MSNTWIYILIPNEDLNNSLPDSITKFDFPIYDEDGNETIVHPTFKEAAQNKRSVCALGASNGTYTVFKMSGLGLNSGEDLDALRALRGAGDAYKLLTADQASIWAGNI